MNIKRINLLNSCLLISLFYLLNVQIVLATPNTNETHTKNSLIELNITPPNEKENEYYIQADNVELVNPDSQLYFAIWSDVNGQDDLLWYASTKQTDASYSVTVPLRNHQDTGRYLVHAYERLPDNKLEFIKDREFSITPPTFDSFYISNENTKQGTFTLNIDAVNSPSGIASVRFPVWSTPNQSDIIWYTATPDTLGNYSVPISIANHSYHLGTYYMDAYAVDGNGNESHLQSLEYSLAATPGDLDITVATNMDGSYSVKLKKGFIPGGIKDVTFAVWSDASGQDDIVWYPGTNKDQVFTTNIRLENHKSIGTFFVHAYATTYGNEKIKIAVNEFMVSTPSATQITVNKDKTDDEAFIISISGIINQNSIREIRVPIWCSPDQSDITWYNALLQSDGTYKVFANIKNHKYSLGNYKIHVYLKTYTNEQIFAGGNEYQTDVTVSDLTVNIDKNNPTYYDGMITDINIPGGFSEIIVAVWSEKNNQDDFYWYNSSKTSGNDYSFRINLKNHKSFGVYSAHAYAKTRSGNLVFLKGLEFSTTAPTLGKMEVTNLNKDQGTFTINISEVEYAAYIQEIKVPVWCSDTQNDIVWYLAQKQKNGIYTVTVNMANHLYHTGPYKIHSYIVDLMGTSTYSNKTECDLSVTPGLFTVTDKTKREIVFEGKLHGTYVPAGASALQFAVWSENKGQDDLRWYTANAGGTSDIPIKNHRTLGTYYVDAYAKTKNNDMIFLNRQLFKVDTKTTGNISISDADRTKGTFKVTISDVASLSGINEIRVPVWSGESQRNIAWYSARKVSTGNYEIIVNVNNHQKSFGQYFVDTYAVMGNGIEVNISHISYEFTPLNYLKIDKLTKDTCLVTLLNPNNGNVDNVNFPTWSDLNGQDDVVWYSGSNNGNNSWSAIIGSNNHKSGGRFLTDAYVSYTGTNTRVNGIDYQLERISNFTDRISSFSTVSTNDMNGTFNMMKALDQFNGLVLNPGQTLSFNQTTGYCGQANGYLPAGVVGGIDYGGGICQSSTTLYGAAVRAGLTIVQRQNHSVPSTYVPIGLDAMVSWSTSDLQFRNDYNFPIKIITYTRNRVLNVEFYGNQPNWFDSIEPTSWKTGSRTASGNRIYYKNGIAVRIDSLPNSFYSW